MGTRNGRGGWVNMNKLNTRNRKKGFKTTKSQKNY